MYRKRDENSPDTDFNHSIFAACVRVCVIDRSVNISYPVKYSVDLLTHGSIHTKGEWIRMACNILGNYSTIGNDAVVGIQI